MRIRCLTVAGLTVLALPACGVNSSPSGSPFATSPVDNGEISKTGPEVAEDAAKTLLMAGAVTVMGSVRRGGQEQRIDLHLQGHDLTGAVQTGGYAVELIEVNGVLYAKTQAGFWSASGVPQDIVSRLDGRWVIAPQPVASALTPVSLTGLADDLRDPPGTTTILDGVHRDTIHDHNLREVSGDPVVVVTESDGTTIDVAATGEPYPLLIAHPDNRSDPLTFSYFEEQQPIAVPSSPVDLGRLGG